MTDVHTNRLIDDLTGMCERLVAEKHRLRFVLHTIADHSMDGNSRSLATAALEIDKSIALPTPAVTSQNGATP